MTETALEKRLSELRDPIKPPSPTRSREYRRKQERKHFDRMFQIVSNSCFRIPGYVDWAEDENGNWRPSGKYIKYPKNSNCQRWMKRLTSKKTRKAEDISVKGNDYRRIFDYWWTLY